MENKNCLGCGEPLQKSEYEDVNKQRLETGYCCLECQIQHEAQQAVKQGLVPVIAKESLEDLKRRAFRAYFRRFGKNADQPSQIVDLYEDERGKQFLVLSNVNGSLAIYRILKDGNLKFSTLER